MKNLFPEGKTVELDMSILSGDLPVEECAPASDGWHYAGDPPENGDARKIVTLEQDGMVWVGIRAWNHRGNYWQNNNDPERATVKAWRDLDEPAKGYWSRGLFYLPNSPAKGPTEAADFLIKAVEDLLDIERRDSTGNPDLIATDTWREKAWSNVRAAISAMTDGVK